MVTSVNNSGGIPPVFSPSAGSVGTISGTGRAEETASHFDQVEISREPSGSERFRKELSARLVREVRTANSTGNVQKIRMEIQSRAYRADPAEIAAKMLLEGGPFGE